MQFPSKLWFQQSQLQSEVPAIPSSTETKKKKKKEHPLEIS